MPSHYAEFVKAHYNDVKSLPVKERFAALAMMWNKQKVNADDKDIKKDKPTKDKPTKVKKQSKQRVALLFKAFMCLMLLKS